MKKRSKKWHEKLVKSILADPEGRAAYEAFKVQLEVADKLKKARNKAHLTQEQVAEEMGTKKSVIARLESAGGKAKHSPSIATLVKYANAVGYRMEIKLIPDKIHAHA